MAAAATRRVGKSAIDWAAFKERVQPIQLDKFRLLKQRSDMYINRVIKYPESLPKIDFSYYKSQLGALPMIDQFEKSYSSVEIPYPKDKNNVVKALEELEVIANKEIEQFKKEQKESTSEAQYVLDNLHLIPPPEEMNIEMMYYYFPDLALDPENRPTVFPHTKSAQLECTRDNVLHDSEITGVTPINELPTLQPERK